MLVPIRPRHLMLIAITLGAFAAWIRFSRLSIVALGASNAVGNTSGASRSASQVEASNPGEVEIGGQKVIQLSRKATLSESIPEFLSAIILPGRGMNLFQITAKIPGKGIVQVFASPSLEEAKTTLDGGAADSHGVKSFTFGGAFLVPYPNRIRGELASDGQNIVTHWNGRTLTLPADWKAKSNPNAELHAIHGLILDRKTDQLKVHSTKDGQAVEGVIHAGDFGGHWLSKTDLTIAIDLGAKSLEASITAKNVGSETEPIGIGWHPYFAMPSGDRGQVRLHIPASEMAQVNNYDDVFPTGRLVSVTGTKYDFATASGKALGNIFLDDNFCHLTRSGGKVVVDLIDPAAKYGIYIEGLSHEIKTIQVYAPPDKPYAAIEEQFNYADPFSSIWGKMNTGMVTLSPGQTVAWKVQLVLFTPE